MRDMIQDLSDKLTKENVSLRVENGNPLYGLNFISNERPDDEDITRITDVITDEISYIKKNILGDRKKIKELINKRLSENQLFNPMKNFKVVKSFVPMFIEELISREIIDITLTDRKTKTMTDRIVKNKDLTGDEIMGFLTKRMSPALENMMLDEIGPIEKSDVIEIWEDYILNISSTNKKLWTIEGTTRHGIVGFDLFVALLIVKGLYDIDNSPKNSDYNKYRDAMIALEQLLENKLARFINDINREISHGVLVRNTMRTKDTDFYKLNVIKDVYDGFIKTYPVDILFGARFYFGADKNIHMNVVTSRLGEIEHAWKRHITKLKTTHHLKINADYRSTYFDVIRGVLNPTNPDYIPYMGYSPSATTKTVPSDNDTAEAVKIQLMKDNTSIVKKILTGIPTNMIQDIDHVTESVVVALAPKRIRVKRFLESMRTHSKKYGDLTGNEAATYATIDYIAEYLTHSISVNIDE